MIAFRSYLNEAKYSAHMEHIDDLVFNLGTNGTRQAIFFLRDVRGMLTKGTGSSNRVITQKWDGCVHEDTIVKTSIGDITIKKLLEEYEKNSDIMVYGRDFDSPIIQDKAQHILGTNKSNPEKNWIEIQLENGSTLKLTEDHEVYTTNRGWQKAIDLQPDDDIQELTLK